MCEMHGNPGPGIYCRQCGEMTCELPDCECDCFRCHCPCHGETLVSHDG